MKLLPLLCLGLVSLASGCGTDDGTSGEKDVDSDGDGLFDSDEAAYGTDPANADSDADGIGDGDEVEMGTDPIQVDSDGDGYRDGDEVTVGTDPTDVASVIYTGGWPYNADKGSMVDPGWEGRGTEGAMLPNFKWLDQFDQEVDIYDFAMQGKPMVLDVSTVWCGWCRVMAAWIGGDMSEAQDEIDQGYDFEGAFSGEPWWDLVPALVQNGDIYWVTAITQDVSGGAPTQRDVNQWAESFPNDNVPVLLDEEAALEDYLRVRGFPTLFLLDENLVFTVAERNDYTAVFTRLLADYGD